MKLVITVAFTATTITTIIKFHELTKKVKLCM